MLALVIGSKVPAIVHGYLLHVPCITSREEHFSYHQLPVGSFLLTGPSLLAYPAIMSGALIVPLALANNRKKPSNQADLKLSTPS